MHSLIKKKVYMCFTLVLDATTRCGAVNWPLMFSLEWLFLQLGHLAGYQVWHSPHIDHQIETVTSSSGHYLSPQHGAWQAGLKQQDQRQARRWALQVCAKHVYLLGLLFLQGGFVEWPYKVAPGLALHAINNRYMTIQPTSFSFLYSCVST